MYIGSKGWYVQELKAMGINRWEGKHLSSYKGSFLAYLYHKHKS